MWAKEGPVFTIAMEAAHLPGFPAITPLRPYPIKLIVTWLFPDHAIKGKSPKKDWKIIIDV